MILNGQTGLYHNILFLAHFNTELLVLFDELLLGRGFLFSPITPSDYAIMFTDSHGLAIL